MYEFWTWIMSLFIHKQPNIISNNILPSPPPPPPTCPTSPQLEWVAGSFPPTQGGGGGGWNAIRYQILDPLKNQISDIRPPKKIKYQIVHKNQISGLTKSDVGPQKKKKYQISHPLKNRISRYPRSTHPAPPPPPHSVTPCDPGLRRSLAAPLRSFAS